MVSLQRSIYCYGKVLKSIICSSCIKTEDIKYNVDIWFLIIKKYFHCFFTGFTLGWFSLVLFTTFIQVYGVPYTHTHAHTQIPHTHTHRHWFSLQPLYRYTVYHTHTHTDRYHTHTHTHRQTDTTHTHTDTGSLYNLYTGIRYTTHTDRQTDK